MRIVKVLLSGCLGFFIFIEFSPKTQNVDFSKLLVFKIEKFQAILKTDYMLSRTRLQHVYTQHVYTISKQYPYFWMSNGKKTGKGNEVTF